MIDCLGGGGAVADATTAATAAAAAVAAAEGDEWMLLRETCTTMAPRLQKRPRALAVR